MAYTLFISDLHLDEYHSQSAEIFFNFLDTRAALAEAVYILGDFFETWIGDDNSSIFITKVKSSLKKLTQSGTPIYLMGGNRDFLLGKRFAKDTGCKLIPDVTTINLYRQKVVLTHGDALCTYDIDHMKFRKLTNNRLVKRLFLLLPLTLRKKIGDQLRQHSKQHTQKLATSVMDVAPDAVINTLQEQEANVMIHGHTHRPIVVNIQIGDKHAQRIVLGSWEHQGCCLQWNESGKKELIFFS